MAASAQNLLLKGFRAVAGPGRQFFARSKESSVFAKFLHHFWECLERKQKICSLVTQVGPVEFLSSSNALMQRNLAICNDN